MESSGLRLLSVPASGWLLLLPLLLGARARAQDPDYPDPPDPPAPDLALDPALRPRAALPDYHGAHQKELIEALQEVLKKLKSKRIPVYEKKYGQVPMCDAGEQCAVRKGARIGKLCDCPRGTVCNSFLLKCL
ncbi:cocaine- and amphetamine-regulated transcript protein [Tachyglossus aculeatus]|uniref:cocaine- and amphetamine-regulated transcript protein n=1 Tax=Tachyglossus aculeatus TaxID=9261 RepID=UPI0018F47F7A|nr:cocaine- and amphetamine-regulated transcript protein [Tachyglossus aculeatus]